MASKDLVFRFLGVDAGAGREFDRMAGKSAGLEKAVGKMALGFVAAGAGLAVESVRMAAKFQTSMELLHTQAGASQAEVNKLSGAVLKLAGPVATAPQTLTEGLYHLESAGFRGAKAMAALKVAAEGAKIGGANLEDVTNALNATLVSGISGASNMNQAMGALNATVGAGDMRMQDLAEALGTGVLAAVKGFGLSLNDVGAALATFGDNNIRGADAATQLRMAVLFMAKPAATAKATLKDLGLTSHSLANDMGKGGLGLALKDLHDKLLKAGDTGAKMGQVLLNLFGHKAGTGVAILEQQYARFQQKQEQVHTGSKNFASDWTAYTKTFGYSWDSARAAFQSMTIEIGDKLLPVATKAMHWIGTKGVADLDKFGSWVSRNKRPIEDVAKALAAIAVFKFATGKLNDISRLLGGGRGALGGGILGSAKPIPVYVTNSGFGGPGGKVPPVVGGGGPLGKGDPLGKGGPLGLGGGVKGFVKTLPLYGVGANSDVKQGLGSALTYALVPLLAQIAKNRPHGAPNISSLFSGYNVKPEKAIDYIKTYGTPKQIADLKKLAATVPEVAAAFGKLTTSQQKASGVLAKLLLGNSGLAKFAKTSYGDSDRSLRQQASTAAKTAKATTAAFGDSDRSLRQQASTAAGAAGKVAGSLRFLWHQQTSTVAQTATAHRRAVDDIIAQLRRIPGAMAQLAAEARDAGNTIGQQLDAGISVGISQGSGNVKIVTKQLVDGVVHTATMHAQMSSPSKRTIYIGKMIAQGVAVGIGEKTSSAVSAAQRLVDKVTSKLDALKGNASGVMNGIVGTLNGGADLSNVPTTDSFGATMRPGIGSITGYLSDYLRREKAFARNLALARKKGLSAGEAAQIAQMGLDQGGPIAQTLAHASRHQLAQINALDNSIARTSHQIGASAADAMYGKQERALIAQQKRANHLLELLVQLAKREKHLTEADIARLIKELVIVTDTAKQDKKNGHKVMAH